MFGTKKWPATLPKIDQQGAVCQYVITAEVPAFNFTGSQSSQVSVYLLMESGDGELMDIGPFHCFDEIKQEGNNPQVSRKRKVSPESVEVHDPPVKLSSSNHLRSKEDVGEFMRSDHFESTFPLIQFFQLLCPPLGTLDSGFEFLF
jgi:hypothetical protein